MNQQKNYQNFQDEQEFTGGIPVGHPVHFEMQPSNQPQQPYFHQPPMNAYQNSNQYQSPVQAPPQPVFGLNQIPQGPIVIQPYFSINLVTIRRCTTPRWAFDASAANRQSKQLSTGRLGILLIFGLSPFAALWGSAVACPTYLTTAWIKPTTAPAADKQSSESTPNVLISSTDPILSILSTLNLKVWGEIPSFKVSQ